MDFPHTPFTIYDSFHEHFLLMPTWSRYDVCGDTPIIIWPLEFEDEDCKRLNGLLGQLSNEKKATKEREVCNDRSGPGFKRKQALIMERKVAT